ncbi:putative nuclease HARBI1 [Acropora cervicornis]|uniref:Nuclease HARBI1 n=1 Tax=Acropora cervicornis TaxID=6130 RepID=A0AAD9V7K2_ACRCE|nr:putative nuclease HARBI1 [Acropora cervicornis]
MTEKVGEFEAKFGLTQGVGCIDGTHIPIECPSGNSQDFFCYKQCYSLRVPAVCDYKGSFIDVEYSWPGSVHDAKVFGNSSIHAKLRSSKLPSAFQTRFEGSDKILNYLIGDPAYPLLSFCMKEY